MAKIAIETNKVKEVGEELKVIATDYTTIIHDMYEKLVKIEESGTWVSEGTNGSVKVFIDEMVRNRTQAETLGTNISDLGNKITEYADSMSHVSDDKL
jgi:flavorubredoxin